MRAMIVLGIETSCDETGVAIYDTDAGLRAHVLYSQVDLHAEYGGVVPELASRDHVRKLAPLVEQCLTEANLNKQDLDGIAYTAGPGLIGALFVGASFAKSMAQVLNIPALGVHHMEGHLLAPMLESETPDFPFVALLVSGGHSMLVDVAGIGEYRILGQSLDDAAGEAFDKTAKIMDLGYPGGPRIAALAQQGDAEAFDFPRPMVNRPGLDLSFSGLKTHTANLVAAHPDRFADIAAGFQEAVVATLAIKCKRALKQTGYRRLVVAGGVGANQSLRQRLSDISGCRAYYPSLKFCTDNGAMIALAGALRLQAGEREDDTIRAHPRWSLESLPALGATSS